MACCLNFFADDDASSTVVLIPHDKPQVGAARAYNESRWKTIQKSLFNLAANVNLLLRNTHEHGHILPTSTIIISSTIIHHQTIYFRPKTHLREQIERRSSIRIVLRAEHSPRPSEPWRASKSACRLIMCRREEWSVVCEDCRTYRLTRYNTMRQCRSSLEGGPCERGHP